LPQTPHRRHARAIAFGATVAAALMFTGACATGPRSVSKIVNGRIVVTRAISPEAYDHVARALLFEEEARWEEAARELQRALPFDDGAAEVRAHLADLFLRLGRVDDAAEQVQRSLEIAETVDGDLAAAHVADARHDEKTALARYQAATVFALSDDSPDAVERTHLALADAQLAALDVSAAHETIRALCNASLDSVRARVELAALAWALGRVPDAEAALIEALKLEPAQVDARLTLAALYAATGRAGEAKAAFRETLDRTEDPIDIAEMFLKWLAGRGDKAEAATEADRLTPDTIDESTVETVIRIERAAGRPARAIAAAEQAIKKGAPPARVALLVSGALVDNRDRAGAAARLLKIPGGAPEFIESRLRAAEALREGIAPPQAQLDQASRLVDQATAAFAATPAASAQEVTAAGQSTTVPPAPARDWTTDLAVARALLDEKRGDAVRAARTLDAALEKDAGNPRLLLVRAAIDDRRGEWRRALGFAEKILAADPRNVEALNFHGFISVDHDSNLPIATRRLQAAMALDPGAGGIVDSLGWGYVHAGDLTRGAELLVEADRLEPGDPEILSHLADLFTRQKDVPRAIATYRRALGLEPPEKLAREINERLRRLDAKTAAER
jgi:tetratricopeptide (TPR) repeat protein